MWHSQSDIHAILHEALTFATYFIPNKSTSSTHTPIYDHLKTATGDSKSSWVAYGRLAQLTMIRKHEGWFLRWKTSACIDA